MVEHISLLVAFLLCLLSLTYWFRCFIFFHKIKKLIKSYDLAEAWKIWDRAELKQIKSFTEVMKNV